LTFSRLPIIVLAGPADDLKLRLSNHLMESNARSYAIVAESALGDRIARAVGDSAQPNHKPNQISIDGCLCCVGAVTLMAKLMRLLRADRQKKMHQGLLVVAGTQTKLDALIDQLRQPLLANLVEVKTVIYATHEMTEAQADAIASADIVYSSQIVENPSVLSAPWLLELPGSDKRVCTLANQHLPDLFSLMNSTNCKGVWPAEKVFSRQKAHSLFEQAAKDGVCFDAVLHTPRAWYRWKTPSDEKYATLPQETTYRRHSYLHCWPGTPMQERFAALLNSIEIAD
jgi:hypothetical protein